MRSQPGGALRCVPTRFFAAALVLLAATGCALTANTPAPSPAPYEARATLAADLSAAHLAQESALALWDRIIFGETVSCLDLIAVPEPAAHSDAMLAAHPDAATIQARINAGLQSVRNSSDLWNIECASEMPFVTLSMAREGRATALAASEPLDAAAALLAAWE